jgi:2-oxo-4-hydroxy-4-carboxy-5-ureidoimidazoline decarboxylase
MTIDDLNAKDRIAFVEAVGFVFEDSPWVAERAWDLRPFTSLDALHDAMTSMVAAAAPDEQVALLRAHPDLGDRAALEPDTSEMSAASKREQTGAGLAILTRAEVDRLSMLNAAYREKFGFPFLYAVKGSTKHDILGALERRMASTPAAEYEEALRQVYRIARFRLEELMGEPS